MKLHIKTQDIEIVYEDECSYLYTAVTVDILKLIDKIRDHKAHNHQYYQGTNVIENKIEEPVIFGNGTGGDATVVSVFPTTTSENQNK